jgi:dephospho-CoA kinase
MSVSGKPVLGLVGGIGSGKSTVAGLLKELGGYVIDADQFGHEALRQPDVRERIFARWGQQVLEEEGEVSRRKLAGIVFADSAERRALQDLVFPWIEGRIREEIERASGDARARFIVLDAAILLETGWGKACDAIVFVAAPRDIRLKRIAAKRGWSEKEVETREQAQFSLDDKAARAQYTIDNAGDLAQTRLQVEALLRHLRLTPQAHSGNP